jgi:AraC-like DNA-binding protein
LETRTLLVESDLIRAERLGYKGLTRQRTPEVHSPESQVLFPLAGIFNWHVGASRTLLNPNHVLFISAGDVSQDSHPATGDVDCLLLTPDITVLESLWGGDLARPPRQSVFRLRTMASDTNLQRAANGLAGMSSNDCPLASADREECSIALLAAAARNAGVSIRHRRPRRGALEIEAVKEQLSTADAPLSLGDLARRFQVSPAYLTDTFRRSEGMPVARYQRRLRFARALIELPHTDDITGLAFRLGFSSHAHFSSAFKSTFGQTPSEYRACARRADVKRFLSELGAPDTG